MGFLMDRAYIAKHRKHYDIVTSFWDLGDGNTTAAAAAEGAISWDQIYRRRVFRQMSLERLWTPVHLAAKNEDVGVLQAMLFFGARTDLLKIMFGQRDGEDSAAHCRLGGPHSNGPDHAAMGARRQVPLSAEL